jgi:hypothetical protein
MNEEEPYLTHGIVTSCSLADRETSEFLILMQEIGDFPDGY